LWHENDQNKNATDNKTHFYLNNLPYLDDDDVVAGGKINHIILGF
jgi:hypothetical protein